MIGYQAREDRAHNFGGSVSNVFMLTLLTEKSKTASPGLRDAVVDLSDGDCIVAYQHDRGICMLFRTGLNLGGIAARLDPVLPEEDKYFIAAMGEESLFYKLNQVSAWLQQPLSGRCLAPQSQQASVAEKMANMGQNACPGTEPPKNKPKPRPQADAEQALDIPARSVA